jgi:hypothetical protein
VVDVVVASVVVIAVVTVVARRGCLFGCGWKRSTKKVASGQAGFFAARAL